jgi:hypothetical protein
MNSPSRYAGLAAVFVLGVGLLIVGNTWAGVCTLGLGVFAMAIDLAPCISGKALVVAIGALICCAVLVSQAASNEITGRANYHQRPFSRGDTTEAVTRKTSPAKFRAATNLLWGLGLTGALVSVGGFVYCRKADAADHFP